jgi:hypothetical protein
VRRVVLVPALSASCGCAAYLRLVRGGVRRVLGGVGAVRVSGAPLDCRYHRRWAQQPHGVRFQSACNLEKLDDVEALLSSRTWIRTIEAVSVAGRGSLA